MCIFANYCYYSNNIPDGSIYPPVQLYQLPNTRFQQVYILRVEKGHSALYNLNGNESYEVK